MLFKFFDLKKKELGLKDFAIYDCMALLPSKAKERYSYDEAIELLKKISTPKDVIILAGKGHEDYQILKDKTIHFDDREEVQKVFN